MLKVTQQDINTVSYSIPGEALFQTIRQGHLRKKSSLHAPSMLLTGKSVPVPNHTLSFPNTQPKQPAGFEKSSKSILMGCPSKFDFHGKHAQPPVEQVTTKYTELIQIQNVHLLRITK